LRGARLEDRFGETDHLRGAVHWPGSVIPGRHRLVASPESITTGLGAVTEGRNKRSALRRSNRLTVKDQHPPGTKARRELGIAAPIGWHGRRLSGPPIAFVLGLLFGAGFGFGG